MNLIISFRSELLKTKRSAAWYFTIIAAALIPLIFVLDIIFDGISPENTKDPFNAIFRQAFMIKGVMIFPLYVTLLCTLLPQVEYRNNTWKQVFSSPQTMLHIFLAKFINVHLHILLFLVSFNALMMLCIVAIHFLDPSLNLLNQPLDVKSLLTNNMNSYIAMLAISAIQFVVGLKFKNFIVPVAIGFMLWVIGNIVVLEMHSSNAYLFPFSYPVMTVFSDNEAQLNKVQLFSVGYAIVFLVVGFLDFRRRNIKS